MRGATNVDSRILGCSSIPRGPTAHRQRSWCRRCRAGPQSRPGKCTIQVFLALFYFTFNRATILPCCNWDIERGPTLDPTSTEQMEESPRHYADTFLRSIGRSTEGEEELGVGESMGSMSITPSPDPPKPPPPPQVSPNPTFTLPASLGERRRILDVDGERTIHEGEIERGMRSMSITPSPNPPKPPPPTPSGPLVTLPLSRGEEGSRLAVDNGSSAPELVHPLAPILTRPSPQGTPTRSTPGEPSRGEPSCEGVGGSEVEGEGERVVEGEETRRKRAHRGRQAGSSKRRARARERKEEKSGNG